MRRKRLAEAAIARIERYQHTRGGRGKCGFSPTCSRYAKEAFQLRSFPTALLMTMSRLARCNLFAGPDAHDPVVRTRRGLRSNALRSLSIIFLLSGVALIALASAGHADSFSGSCTGRANGRDIAKLTQSNPLALKEHQRFSASGTAGFAGPSNPTRVSAKFEIISGVFGVSEKSRGGTGNEWSSSTVNVDEYFDIGLGLYQVKINVSGSGGSCEATAFVKLDGNPLSKPAGIAAAVVTMVGIAGAAAAGLGGSGPNPKADPGAFAEEMLDANDKAEAERAAEQKREDNLGLDSDDESWNVITRFLGCIPGRGIEVEFSTAALMALPVFGMGAGAVAAAKPRVAWSKNVRRSGHPVLGFFSGLLGGLGAVVLVWQYGVWTLQIWNVVGIPLLLAVLIAIAAKRGRVYQIQRVIRRTAPSANEEPPPPPAPTS